MTPQTQPGPGVGAPLPLRPLSTFRTERFNIKLPRNRESLGIVEEAIYLLRRHFLNRHMFTEADWASFRKELSEYSDPQTAVARLLSKLDDPYTRFIPDHIMSERANIIRGEQGTCGIEFSRVWSSQILGEVLRRVVMGMDGFSRKILVRVGGPSLTIAAPLPSPAAAQIPQPLLSGPKFWGYLGATLDTVFPLIISAWIQLHPGRLPGQFKRLVGAACLLSILLSSTRRVLPIVRPYQVTALSGLAKGEGLQIGDLLLFVNSERVLSISKKGLRRLLDDGGEIGELIELGIWRRGLKYGGGLGVAPGESSLSHPNSGKENPSVKIFRKLFRFPGLVLGKILPQNNSGKTFMGEKNTPPLDQTREISHPNVFFTLNVTREAALLPKVFARLLPTAQGDRLGYLAIEEFTDNTLFEVKRGLEELHSMARGGSEKVCRVGENNTGESERKDLAALIIDLRGNPGGPLSAALDVAALFLPRGTVLTQIVIRGVKEKHTCTNPLPDKKTSLLLLTDSSTASASEIFVASLRDNKRAESFGRRTVGKNLAQAVIMLSDRSGLAFTVAEYLTPGGSSMADGIMPDRVIFERDLDNIQNFVTFREPGGFQVPKAKCQKIGNATLGRGKGF